MHQASAVTAAAPVPQTSHGFSGQPSLSAYTQVGADKTWIDDTLGASGQQAIWVSAVPEPSLPSLLITGGLIAGIAARRGQRATR